MTIQRDLLTGPVEYSLKMKGMEIIDKKETRTEPEEEIIMALIDLATEAEIVLEKGE